MVDPKYHFTYIFKDPGEYFHLNLAAGLQFEGFISKKKKLAMPSTS